MRARGRGRGRTLGPDGADALVGRERRSVALSAGVDECEDESSDDGEVAASREGRVSPARRLVSAAGRGDDAPEPKPEAHSDVDRERRVQVGRDPAAVEGGVSTCEGGGRRRRGTHLKKQHHEIRTLPRRTAPMACFHESPSEIIAPASCSVEGLRGREGQCVTDERRRPRRRGKLDVREPVRHPHAHEREPPPHLLVLGDRVHVGVAPSPAFGRRNRRWLEGDLPPSQRRVLAPVHRRRSWKGAKKGVGEIGAEGRRERGEIAERSGDKAASGRVRPGRGSGDSAIASRRRGGPPYKDDEGLAARGEMPPRKQSPGGARRPASESAETCDRERGGPIVPARSAAQRAGSCRLDWMAGRAVR